MNYPDEGGKQDVRRREPDRLGEGRCGHRDDPTVAAVAALLIALTVILVLLVERFIGLEKFMTLD